MKNNLSSICKLKFIFQWHMNIHESKSQWFSTRLIFLNAFTTFQIEHSLPKLFEIFLLIIFSNEVLFLAAM